MEAIQLPQLWTVGAVLAGFQVAALTWRINREASMETEDETTWVTLANGFVAASFVGIDHRSVFGASVGKHLDPNGCQVAWNRFDAVHRVPFRPGGSLQPLLLMGQESLQAPRNQAGRVRIRSLDKYWLAAELGGFWDNLLGLVLAIQSVS